MTSSAPPEEAVVQPAVFGSFWEVGQYKHTVKRVDDSYKQSNKLIEMIEDRCRIENEYAKNLKDHAKQWTQKIERGPEYGTMETSLKDVLNEADQVCEQHLAVRDRLQNDVVSQIKSWQKESYKTMMMARHTQTKQAKEVDDSFRKAQKPWEKLYERVMKARSNYHKACKMEKSAINQEGNAKNDTAQSIDAQNKLTKLVEKCREDKLKTRERYDAALIEINNYNAKYMEDMQQVFEKCQEMEERRLRFFKEVLFGVHRCLDNIQDYPAIYQSMYQSIQSADYERDLKWWDNNHGTAMAMNWPTFQDYAPDSHAISRKERKGNTAVDGQVMLTNINRTNDTREEIQQQHAADPAPPTSGNNIQANGKNTLSSTSSNPFDEDEEQWDDYSNDAIVDNGAPGVPVRALYDYAGTEDDELSFKQGEEFVKLEDEDEQGWCKGRVNGRVGLYPANYVDVV